MQKAEQVLHQLYCLEYIADGKGPRASLQLLTAVIYIFFILSIAKHDTGQLLIWGIYPLIMVLAADLSFRRILKDLLAVSPIILFLAVGELFMNRETAATVGGFALSWGMLSFSSLIFRSIFSISLIFILLRSRGMLAVIRSLEFFRIPPVFRDLLMLLYRYIILILRTGIDISNARRLRGSSGRRFRLRDAGQVLGRLFLGSRRLSSEIYEAMLLRQYRGHLLLTGGPEDHRGVMIYGLLWTALFAVFRRYPPLSLLADFLERGI